ncbi:MAG TPA: redoxin domain-containing protein [Gemmataceae bacterium]|nr:redoxin domain-containing protein [Gemmataceae bacterium]
MTATLYLIGCLLAPAQAPVSPLPQPGENGKAERPAPAFRGEWAVAPHLTKAQELVYRGTFTEEADGAGVQFNRNFRLETRVFVMDASAKGADAAFFTVLKSRDAQANVPAGGAEPAAESVRLELAHVDLQGDVTADPGVSLAVPLEGPPTVECGVFTALPDGKVTADSTWEATEEGRPVRSWRVVGVESIDRERCLKLEGVQKSDDWDKPRGDRAAWRRTDTVWLSPRLGAASQVERVIERREPAHRQPTYKSVLRYNLEEPMQWPDRLAEDRQREITQARAFADAAAPLLTTPAKYGPQLTALMNRIAYHLDHQPKTDYREAILQVKRRIEAAQRGETPPAPANADTPDATPAVVAVGAPAPDFLAPDLVGARTFRLRSTLGQPVLLVFYNPASPSAPVVLAYAQQMSDAHKDVTVLTLSMTGDGDAARKQHADLKLTVPLLDGNGLRTSYDVNGTPQLMVLDGKGVLRGDFTGWGRETAEEVMEELGRCGKK